MDYNTKATSRFELFNESVNLDDGSGKYRIGLGTLSNINR
jgi:hypothetical protein